MFLGCGGEIATKNKLIVVRGVSLNGNVPHDFEHDAIRIMHKQPENAYLAGKIITAAHVIAKRPRKCLSQEFKAKRRTFSISARRGGEKEIVGRIVTFIFVSEV